jgi:hypothetical protein
MSDQDINNLTEIESDYYFSNGIFSNKDFCKFNRYKQ